MNTIKLTIIFSILLTAFCCSRSSVELKAEQSISGTYVRITKAEISNLETGSVVDIREIRDTIFVTKAADHYLIMNRKWQKNDYDQQGWVTMAHSDNRPMPDYEAVFELESKTLVPKLSHVDPILYFNPETHIISKDQFQKTVFIKVQ